MLIIKLKLKKREIEYQLKFQETKKNYILKNYKKKI